MRILLIFCSHISFSQMVSSPANRQTFITSVITFLRKYEFDGLDIDWEYPANRGGSADDKENYSVFLEVCLSCLVFTFSQYYGLNNFLPASKYNCQNLFYIFSFHNKSLRCFCWALVNKRHIKAKQLKHDHVPNLWIYESWSSVNTKYFISVGIQ